MVKRFRVAVTAAAIVILCAALGPGRPISSADTFHVEWRVQVAAPAEVPLGQTWAALANELDQRTKGQVKLSVYYNSGLKLPDGDLLAMVRDDILQVGSISGHETEPSFPESNVLALPGLLTGDPAVRRRAAKAVTPYYTKALADKWNQVYLGYCSLDPRAIISKAPIQNINDLKGVKVRAVGSAEIEVSKALGMIPVGNIITAELYSGIQSGVIQAAWGPNSYFHQAKFYEVGKYDYNAGLGGSAVLFTVNKAEFNKIGAANQKILKETAAEVTSKCVDLIAAADQAAIAGLRSQGVTVVQPTPQDAAQIRMLTQKAQNDWLAQFPQGKDLLATVRAALTTSSAR